MLSLLPEIQAADRPVASAPPADPAVALAVAVLASLGVATDALNDAEQTWTRIASQAPAITGRPASP